MKKLIVIAALFAACGKSKEECRAEAIAVGDLLVAAANEPPSALSVPEDVRLVVRTDIPIRRDLREAPIVTVSPTQLRLAGNPVADLAALGRELADGFARLQEDLASGRIRETSAPEPQLVYLVIDPQTSWERVVAVVGEAAKAGLIAPAFVFEQPQTLTQPPRAKVDDKLDAIMKADASDRATQLAGIASKIVERCAPLQKAFGNVSSEEGDKAMTLASAVMPALVACDCNVNIPDLRSVMFRIIYVPRPLRVITFAADAASQRIELPAATTWAEASKRFTPPAINAELIAR